MRIPDTHGGQQEICQVGKQAPETVLSGLHESQAGHSRHKCCVCAYDEGVKEGLRRARRVIDEIIAGL
jgi:hypothetical protein